MEAASAELSSAVSAREQPESTPVVPCSESETDEHSGTIAVELCTAAYIGSEARIRELLEKDHSLVEMADYDGRTAIHLAASEGHLEIVKLLVCEYGASHSPKDRWGGTPLDDSIRHKHKSTEAYLRDIDAEVGATRANSSANVAVDMATAAYEGNGQLLQKLVKEEYFNVNASDYDKRTALHLAASEGHLDVVKLLVEELGARLSPVDRWDGTPLDDALRSQHKGVEEFLRSKGAISVSFTTADQRKKDSRKVREDPTHTRKLVAKAATDICTAAQNGRLEEVLRLVQEEGISIDVADYDGRTALHLAASEGNIELVRLLIEELNAKRSPMDRWGHTPLDEAIRGNYDEVVRYLQTKEARSSAMMAHASYNNGDLCVAAAQGDVPLLRHLVRDCGIDVDGVSYDGRTALHLAASEGRLRVVTVLVEELHANTRPLDRWRRTPLDNAVDAKHTAIEEYLRAKGGSSVRKQSSMNQRIKMAALLCDAASEGNLNLLRQLVTSQNFVVDAGDYDSRTALHIAASEGRLDVVQLLVEELGADHSCADRWGGTPLDDAIRQDRTEIAHYLKSVGACKTISMGTQLSSSGNRAGELCDAAFVGDGQELKRLVLHENCDVNASDYDSRTALHLAASEGRLNIVKLLVNGLQADPSPEDRWGGTPLQDALRSETTGHKECAKFLMSDSVKATRLAYHTVPMRLGDVRLTRLSIFCLKGDVEGVARLLTQSRIHGGEELVREQILAAEETMGSTPLHWAAFSGCAELAKLLIETAAALDLPRALLLEKPDNRDLSTPLHVAARRGHAATVETLMNARADANRCTSQLDTALHVCCLGGNAECAKMILKLQRVDLEMKNKDNYTPLLAAIRAGNEEIVKVLLEADAEFDIRTARQPLKKFERRPDAKRKCKAQELLGRSSGTRLSSVRTSSGRKGAIHGSANAMKICNLVKRGSGKPGGATSARKDSGGSHEDRRSSVGATMLKELMKTVRSGDRSGWDDGPTAGYLYASGYPGAGLISEAMTARPARLNVVKQLLLWARRNYIMSSKDSMWTRGCIPMEDVEQIFEVWARSSSSSMSMRDLILLFSLLVLCTSMPDEDDENVDAPPTLIALTLSHTCRERAGAVWRDNDMMRRMLDASSLLELIALGMIDPVYRMHVEGNTDAWPDFSKLDSIWREALLEPVLECAAGNECDIFLAHPLVLSRMRDRFWPSINDTVRNSRTMDHLTRWQRTLIRQLIVPVLQLIYNLLALPFLLFIPSSVEERWTVEFRMALNQGRPAPWGLVWLLPPGKGLLWFITTLIFALLLTLTPPAGAGAIDAWEGALFAYIISWIARQARECLTSRLLFSSRLKIEYDLENMRRQVWLIYRVSRSGVGSIKVHFRDPFHVIDLVLAVCTFGMLIIRVSELHSEDYGAPDHLNWTVVGTRRRLRGGASTTAIPVLYWESPFGLLQEYETQSQFYISASLQTFAAALVYLRLMKILYIFPGIGLMLLMTLRMLGDLRQFLVLLSCVLAAFASALYVWAAFWNPILLEANERAGSSSFSQAGLLLTWWRMVDEALLNTTPTQLIDAGRSATMLFVVGTIMLLFYIVVSLLLLNLLIARFSKSFDVIHERYDLNAALVFARICVAPEVVDLIPMPFSIVRWIVLEIYYLVDEYILFRTYGRVAPRQKPEARVSNATARESVGAFQKAGVKVIQTNLKLQSSAAGSRSNIKNRVMGRGCTKTLADGGRFSRFSDDPVSVRENNRGRYQKSIHDRTRLLRNLRAFVARALLPEVSFFPEAIVEYVASDANLFRVEQRRRAHFV
ncbi:hypothetical protein AB1Y20_023492 [Prymnesium parvum]|uniref:Ion transport domain-containing protein n=1 Tax=Prymnesium parvum TaxID=97485 RepID=A0AB34JGV5_PRYPA